MHPFLLFYLSADHAACPAPIRFPSCRHQLAEPEVTPPPSAKVPRPPLHELVASFAPGTPAWLHDHSQVTCGAIKSRLQAQCDAVASHIADVSSGKALVCRMDLFFKVDVQNRYDHFFDHQGLLKDSCTAN